MLFRSDYWLHFSHIYRIPVENKRLNTIEYRWLRSDRDDWVHATVYWRVGMDRFGGKGAIVRADQPTVRENSYFITPDDRTSVNPLAKGIKESMEKYVWPEQEGDWRD